LYLVYNLGGILGVKVKLVVAAGLDHRKSKFVKRMHVLVESGRLAVLRFKPFTLVPVMCVQLAEKLNSFRILLVLDSPERFIQELLQIRRIPRVIKLEVALDH
jgi:hypothetical protein